MYVFGVVGFSYHLLGDFNASLVLVFNLQTKTVIIIVLALITKMKSALYIKMLFWF